MKQRCEGEAGGRSPSCPTRFNSNPNPNKTGRKEQRITQHLEEQTAKLGIRKHVSKNLKLPIKRQRQTYF